MASQTQTTSLSPSLLVSHGPSKSPTAVEALLSNLESQHAKPLWAQMAKLNPPLPNPTAVPHLWKYESIQPYLLRAGELVTEKQAERRVAMLVNPARSKRFPVL